MSIKEKEALLESFTEMGDKDKAFLLGYCAGRAADVTKENESENKRDQHE